MHSLTDLVSLSSADRDDGHARLGLQEAHVASHCACLLKRIQVMDDLEQQSQATENIWEETGRWIKRIFSHGQNTKTNTVNLTMGEKL